MDFRFFALGNSGDLGFLASAQESQQIMDLIERWHDLVGYMPSENLGSRRVEWRITTG